MVKFQHVDVADGHRPVEGLAGTPVDQGHLARGGEPRLIQHLDDVVFAGAIEHRRRNRNAASQILAQLDHLFIVELGHLGLVGLVAIDLFQLLLEFVHFAAAAPRIEHLANLTAEADAGPAQVGLQDLTHVHAARHAERVEDNVDRGAVLGIGHVLHRNDLRDHALVAVAAGHLVAGL